MSKARATRPRIEVTQELIVALREACQELTLLPESSGVEPRWDLAAVLSAHAEALLLATGAEAGPGLCLACGIEGDHEPWCWRFPLDGIEPIELSQEEADRIAGALLDDVDL